MSTYTNKMSTYTNKMSTYTKGITFKTEKDITKNDIITMCNLLNNKDDYINLCVFEPAAISEGGIVYKFKNNNNKWYKSVRLCVKKDYSKGEWYWINKNVINEWIENNDIIFNKDNTFTIFLKSFHGAPVFTLDELKLWENCFNEIGIVRVGKYPTKKSLITPSVNLCSYS